MYSYVILSISVFSMNIEMFYIISGKVSPFLISRQPFNLTFLEKWETKLPCLPECKVEFAVAFYFIPKVAPAYLRTTGSTLLAASVLGKV